MTATRVFGGEVYTYCGIDTTTKAAAQREAGKLRKSGFLVRSVRDNGMYHLFTRKKNEVVLGKTSKGQWQMATVIRKNGTMIEQRVFVPRGEKFQATYRSGQFGNRSNI